LIMITTRLLACYDDKAGGEGTVPVPVTALLAHLLFLRANGGLTTATALADTFGTAAFVEARILTAAIGDMPRGFLSYRMTSLMSINIQAPALLALSEHHQSPLLWRRGLIPSIFQPFHPLPCHFY